MWRTNTHTKKKNREQGIVIIINIILFINTHVCVCLFVYDAFIKFHHQNHIKFIIMCHNQNSIIFYDAGDFLTDPPSDIHSVCPLRVRHQINFSA